MQRVILLIIAALICMVGPGLATVGEVLKSSQTPGNCPTGLAWDGNYLWMADRKTDLIYKMDKNGSVVNSIPSPGHWPMGLAFDGEHLWNVDFEEKKIYKIDPTNGDILAAIDTPTKNPRGLAWDGKYLWLCDNRDDKIVQLSTLDGTTIKSHAAPAGEPRGLAYDGTYLWVSDRSQDEIYMMTVDEGYVIAVLKAPGHFARGLAWDGQSLWNADFEDDKVYCLSVEGDEPFVRRDERDATIEFTHQFRNYGPGKTKRVDVYFAVPHNRDNQMLEGDIAFEPKPSDLVLDQWGQRFAHFQYQNLVPTDMATTTMKVRAKIYEVFYFVRPEKVGGLDQIPAEIKKQYLVNGSKYCIDDPFIRESAKEAVGDEKNPYWIARQIYQWLMGKMYYELSGGWNIAPTVLKRGNGSCSEYTFVYIALCRASGLPARYVGSVVVRGDDASMDDVFHRWVEVYLPNYGWIPVDPSGGDQESPRAQALYFGHLSNRFLITTENGGDSEYLGWTYNSAETWTGEAKCKVHIESIADWEPVR